MHTKYIHAMLIYDNMYNYNDNDAMRSAYSTPGYGCFCPKTYFSTLLLYLLGLCIYLQKSSVDLFSAKSAF